MGNNSRKGRFELLIIGLVAVVFSILELNIDTFERLVVWAAENESLIVTEIFTLALILAIGLSIYSFRRWREAVALESDKLRLQQTVATETDAKLMMRSYAEAVTIGQEAERQRLARELHDDTIQRLIAINQSVELAAYDLAGTTAAEDLHQMQSLIDETISNVRNFIQELRPPYLDELGLTMALRTLSKETRERTDFLIEFEVEGEPRRLSEQQELTLYRITQSGLSNAVQHSEASFIEIGLQFLADSVRLTIIDDGIGFDLVDEQMLVRTGHFGLINMRERAELQDANFHISSAADRGTAITVTIQHSQ